MIKTTCPRCQQEKRAVEINDDPAVNPKFRRGEIVHIPRDKAAVGFRIVKLDHLEMTLEKI